MVNPFPVILSLPEAAFASHLDLCFLYVECRIPDICVVNSLTSCFCSVFFYWMLDIVGVLFLSLNCFLALKE